MSFIKENNGSRFLLWSLFIVIIDQLTKYLVVYNIEENTVGWSFMAPFFRLVHVHNEGAAFSFLADMGGWQRYFFCFVSVSISALLICSLLRTDRKKKWTCLAISLVIGGAIGNLIDRMVLSYVIDFLLFHFRIDAFSIAYTYPAFNVADIAVCIGAGLLVGIGFFGKEEQSKS